MEDHINPVVVEENQKKTHVRAENKTENSFFYDKIGLNSLISSCLEIERGPTVLFLLL
jgi:hypothetical protein